MRRVHYVGCLLVRDGLAQLHCCVACAGVQHGVPAEQSAQCGERYAGGGRAGCGDSVGSQVEGEEGRFDEQSRKAPTLTTVQSTPLATTASSPGRLLSSSVRSGLCCTLMRLSSKPNSDGKKCRTPAAFTASSTDSWWKCALWPTADTSVEMAAARMVSTSRPLVDVAHQHCHTLSALLASMDALPGCCEWRVAQQMGG